MKNKIKKILITGSSGTIGTRLFERLLEAGYQVTGFDKKHNKWHVNLDRLTIVGDLFNRNDIMKLPTNFDLIIHLAANARVYDLVLSPDLALENIVSTYNILEFARSNKIKKVFFSSSRETYGNREGIIAKEENVDIQLCESPYAASKISDEVLVYSYSRCYGIDYIICRFSNVYGMYDESERFIPLMIKKMKNDQDIKIYGKDKILDFTYIDDCVDGIIGCVKNFFEAKNNVFNIASGSGEKLTKVAQIIKKELRSESKIIIEDNRLGEVTKFVADISKANKVLDYSSKILIEMGIKLSISWYLKYL